MGQERGSFVDVFRKVEFMRVFYVDGYGHEGNFGNAVEIRENTRALSFGRRKNLVHKWRLRLFQEHWLIFSNSRDSKGNS